MEGAEVSEGRMGEEERKKRRRSEWIRRQEGDARKVQRKRIDGDKKLRPGNCPLFRLNREQKKRKATLRSPRARPPPPGRDPGPGSWAQGAARRLR